ncbi:MAG: phage holin family protein [Verrucomicrobiae bacterium]|nr:phage holin family protein [Verrucomicrobiae bacterium]
MAEPPSTDSSGSAPERDRREGIGIGSLSAGVLASLLDHLEARADLFRWEAREARSRLLRRLACLLAGGLMLVATYALGIAALVGWLVQSRELSWPAAAGWVALGQLILGTILLLMARGREGNPLFPDSIAELRRDREALRRRSERTRPLDRD